MLWEQGVRHTNGQTVTLRRERATEAPPALSTPYPLLCSEQGRTLQENPQHGEQSHSFPTGGAQLQQDGALGVGRPRLLPLDPTRGPLKMGPVAKKSRPDEFFSCPKHPVSFGTES